MMIYPRWGSRAQWIEPIRRRQRKKSKLRIKKAIPNGPEGDEIYLNSLILVRHWRFELGD
jgi:hypothetical protein